MGNGEIGKENGELMWREIVGKEMGNIGKENGELMWRKKWGIYCKENGELMWRKKWGKLVWRTGS